MIKKYTVLFVLIFHTTSPVSNYHKNLGNLANERTPGTVFGFGQNITNKNKWIPELNFLHQKITQEELIALYPSLIYGITDYLSFYIAVPTIPKFELDDITAHGIGNVTTQLELAWYQSNTSESQTQATIVGNLTFPTASISGANFSVKDTISSEDSLSVFIGITASYLSPEWYIYISPGYTFNTTSHSSTSTVSDMVATCSTENRKSGNVAYYQFGIGHTFGTPGKITVMGALEFNGSYSKKDTVQGVPQKNSGGNIIYFGPTGCLTHSIWQLQAGIQAPILQKQNGTQRTEYYRTTIIGSLKF